MYDNNTIIIASRMIPDEMAVIPYTQWETHLKNNVKLVVNLVQFLADSERVKNYRNQRLDSLPTVNINWKNTGNVSRVDSLDAIRLNYLFTVSNYGKTIPMVYLMNLANTTLGHVTNNNVTYLKYS